jgi:CO dehydrogenase/acetyl-CoA synthase gamma subunit (corrinoid Fe-S protein)
MSDEHRRKLDNRLTPLHLYKLTPRTSCGECGFPTCLAFSTQVFVGRGKGGKV